MGDNALISIIRSMAPEKLAQDLGSDGFVKSGFDTISMALNALDVEHHTPGIVLLLSAQAKIIDKSKDPVKYIGYSEEWIMRVTALLGRLDTAKLHVVAGDLRIVTHEYSLHLIRHQKSIIGIKPLRMLIKRYSPGTTFITPQHVDFVQLCLASGAASAALAIIGDHPFELSPEKTAVDGKDVRLYLYYAGMAWIANERWEDAIETLRACVQVPAQGCSMIVLEAYKKFVLASLIHTGASEPLSKYFIPSVQRHNKHYMIYDDMVPIFSSQNIETLHRFIIQHREALLKDGNFGLAKQLFAALQRRIVHSLTKTFLTLSLGDIAQRIQADSVSDAETLVVSCIKRGEIHATISQKDGMVSFQTNANTGNADAAATHQLLNERLQNFLKLSATLENAEFIMATDPKYIEKMIVSDKVGSIVSRQNSAGQTIGMDEDDIMRG